MTRRVMVLLLAALALAPLTACGGDNKVGNKALLDFKQQANNRLGETTTTTAAVTTTTVAGARAAATTTTKPKAPQAAAATGTTARSAGAPPATTAAAAAAATAAAQTVREIDIYGDNDPNHEALDPRVQTAYVGSVIRWVNKDTVARSVRADSGQFASPMIQPGGHWDYTAGTVGVFSYSDDSRPYVTGELRVSKP
jgi:cell wall-associated NlpC family hydrolase